MTAPLYFHTSNNDVSFVSASFDFNGEDIRKKLLRLVMQNAYTRPSTSVFSRSLACANALEEAGFKEFEVFSGNDGEILISSFKGSLCFEVTIEPNNLYTINVEEDDQTIVFEEQVSAARVGYQINEALRKQWISSAGFVPNGGAEKNNVGRVWPSKNPQVRMVGQALSNTPVLSRRAAA